MDRTDKLGVFRIFIILCIGFIFIQPANAEPITNTNTMANLFSEFKQAVQQQYTDLNYYQSQLAKMNAISNALSDELKNLTNSALQSVVYEANRQGVGIYVNYLIQSKPRNLFYFAHGTKLSFSNIQAINSAIQRGDFASIQSMTTCPTGQTKCGTMCVNLKTDFGNCGYCGRACVKGQICADWKCMQPVIKMPILR